MISAQPTNVWTLKNCKFRAWSREDSSRAIQFHTADANPDTNELHPIGYVVRTDNDGVVYSENNMQLPNGCFVAEEAIIEASRDGGHTYPISWEVRSQYRPSIVKAANGYTDLLNTSVGGLWGENLNRNDGMIRFTDIYGDVALTQIPVINRSKLHSGIIGTEQLENGSVTDAKLKNGSVTHDKLADNAVEANNIAPGAIALESLVGSIGDLLRFRIAKGGFSTDRGSPTKIRKTDFIIILPLPEYLHNTYISTEEMDSNTFVFLMPWYNMIDIDPPDNYDIYIDNRSFPTEVPISTYVRLRYGFMIFKPSVGDVIVCAYTANHWRTN